MAVHFPPTEGFAVERRWTDHRASIQPGWHQIHPGPITEALAKDHALMRRVMYQGCETRVVRWTPPIEEPPPVVVSSEARQLPGQLTLFGGAQ